MLEAHSVAIVGASPRSGSFGDRLLTELERSPSRPTIHLVNPRHERIGDRRCVPSLLDLDEPVDLVALAVGDASLAEQLARAATHGDRSAVIYGSAVGDGLRAQLAATARAAGMAVCGGGCMGFVNQVHGLRSIGYLEQDPLPHGPIALVTHSGSAFSALLRADRRLGWTVAVSSGQELATTTADYLDYALGLEETRIVALLLETLHDPPHLRSTLERARHAGIPVVALTVGGSPAGQALVAAHSGALAGDDATWEALCDAHGLIRVRDLDEMADTLELLAAGRRARSGGGLAGVHDSGAERALAVDVAASVGATFAEVSAETLDRLGGLLDPGLEPGNPLDVWGSGEATRELFGRSLIALATDPLVSAAALFVDLVPEYDGDESYCEALVDAWDATVTPLCLVTNLPSALDRAAARRLRNHGIPVLEGTRTGLLAMRHLIDLAEDRRVPTPEPVFDLDRRARWLDRLAPGTPALTGAESFELLSDYGVPVLSALGVSSRSEAVEAAEKIGFPVVLKTDDPTVAHKSDVGGVVLGLGTADAVGTAYDELAGLLGPAALVMATAPAGTELALGVLHDLLLGPVVVVGAGGVLIELLADRAVGLPPLDAGGALRLLGRLAVRPLLDGVRGAPAADLDSVAAAIVALSQLALEVGPALAALDVNPLRCGASGAVALDAFVERAGVRG
jgi:acyl-CoA synthetase (NDP forming)